MKLEITTIATGSTGNCYHLKYGNDELLVECGIPLKRIKQALNFKLSKVSGCLISHAHGDHIHCVTSLMSCGIDCYMTDKTRDIANIPHNHRGKMIEHLRDFTVGNFIVLPFKTEHDCPGCVGFLIGIAGAKILFATDTAFVRSRFNGLTHIMIECNYDEKTLENNIGQRRINPFLADRVISTHFGLSNVLDFLKANDLSKVQEIHLIHLSNSNANKKIILDDVRQATGKLVIIP